MNFKLKYSLALLFFISIGILFPFAGNAQLNADFSANTAQGCSPLIVKFKDQSSGNITDYDWRLGAGGTSDSANPTSSYVQPGKYDITLIVSNGSQKDSITKKDFITVFKNPVAGFNANPLNGCVPFKVNFQDQTQIGDAPISSWTWDFGDGGFSNQEDAQHTYLQKGEYKVSLVVEDQNGCTDHIAKNNLIEVKPKPNAKFTAQNRGGCTPPVTVNFTNQSTGKNPLTYKWHFGNGNTSRNPDPAHEYNQSGKFDVKLIVTDKNGCKDTVTKEDFVQIQNFKGKMAVDKDEGCIKPEKTTFHFYDSSTTTPAMRTWHFGDFTTSSLQNPTKAYGSKGVYPVKLITGIIGCVDTLRDTIRVQQIDAAFNASSLFSCKLPFKVNFQDQSTNAEKVKWKFGNNDSSDLTNPSHTYNQEGKFTVRLKATNDIGCIDKTKKQVEIEKPDAKISVKPQHLGLCLGESFDFADSSNSPEAIANWTWKFGDGSSSQGRHPDHTYSDTGTYNVSLKIETINGCLDSANLKVRVGKKPDFSISLDTNIFCASKRVELDTSTNFADSATYHFRKNQIPRLKPEYVYEDTGWFQPYAVPFHNGCQGDTVMLSYDSIHILPPVAKFQNTVDCDSPKYKEFKNFSIGSHSWKWKFGDGDSSSKENPFHKYDTFGRYNVTLEVKNDSTNCTDYTTKPLIIKNIEAHFTMSDSLSCPPTLKNVQFDASASKGVHGRNYSWNFKNGTIINKINTGDKDSLITPPPQDFRGGGTYDVRLAVRNKNLCRDTLVKTIRIYEHKTHIVADPPGGCVPLTVNFSDTTTTDTTITNREWILEQGAAPISNPTPTKTYTKVQPYTIELRTEDARGCKDTATMQLGVSNPSVFFSSFQTEGCKYDSFTFLATSPVSPIDFKWHFGDGDTAMGSEVKHAYKGRGEYDVTLVGIDTNQCYDTFAKPDYIDIKSPAAGIKVNDSAKGCPALIAKFTDTSIGNVTDYYWQFGDSSNSVLKNPQHTYTEPGQYLASLRVKNSLGCADTAYQSISVGGPTADYSVIPDTGCKPLKYQFNAFNMDSVQFVRWTFGDGTSELGDTVTHYYDRGGAFYPSMIISNGKTGDDECEYGIPLQDTIRVDTLDAEFSTSKNSYCIYEDVQISNTSKGTITGWSWRLNPLNRSDTLKIPDFNFDSVMNYDLRLITTNYNGCKDTAHTSFQMHSKPEVFASGGGFICEGEQVQLNSTEDQNFNYQWLPEKGLDRPNQSNPLAGPDSITYYRVQVNDENNCKDTSGKVKVTVQRRPRPVAYPDTTIIRGDSVQLHSSVETAIKGYEWSPDDSLQCTDCPSPYVRPSQKTVYTLKVEDTSSCFTEKDQVVIDIVDKFKVSLPDAFTPNGDGVNDEIHVKGWGIANLITFKVYNRWGELVFETNDIEEGWDGVYKNKPQNPGAYSYYVKAESYTGKVASKEGMFNLVR